MLRFLKRRTYPPAVEPDKVGDYPAFVSSGAGYFYDEVLEYRVWIHPEAGGRDLYDGDDYYQAFATFEEAASFSKRTRGAEEPLVLIRQKEHIDEPEPGKFVHVTVERIAEWRVDWLAGNKRESDSIARFLADRSHA
jgi:hypothetical protein